MASVVVCVALGGPLLAACSSNSSSPTTSGRTSTTKSPASTASGASTSSTSSVPGSSSTTTTSGLTRCATSALTGSVAGSSGAAGTIETTVALKSTAAGPCVLGGYPGLQMLSSAGTALATAVVRKGNYSFTSMAPTTVTVAGGQSVYFNIGYSDVPAGNETTCPSSASLEVTPPNATDHLVMAATLAPCSGGMVTVSPVFASTGANSQTTAPPGG